MTWRTIAHDDEVWHVDPVAERQAHMQSWQLVLSFHTATGNMGRRSIQAPFPMEATSKSALFLQAQSISDKALGQVLSERLA
jgi:hypothetical protein